ncbi:N,N-dimethylformamidase beta subunit family domain-containing protein [Pelagicoccus mobilis]|uniref:N,N-dimethylformamidase beta subunit-like C-terminal domain-containing protein n=1 Tax=Pelagicoccus mobilis TaxID=415221 RepID=A0A934RY93_9BACT|nr:N,N-dimethylformamidase beta subunit family domain-containing protein [Pelagicoccus mobilis]MBK1877454.1 hypothetical protein [Pelagicoccus mobilis]
MNESNDSKRGLHRRDLIKGVAAAGFGLAARGIGSSSAFAGSSVSKKEKQNRIQLENAKLGTRDWRLANTYIDPDTWWRSPRIEGYCSATSVRPGEKLKVMVSTNPVAEFDLEIFRTGYYGGMGGRSMKKFTSIQGKIQPDPPVGENRLRECKWEPSVEFVIPDDWVSGVYLGKLTTKRVVGGFRGRLTSRQGLQSYVIFIVRDDRPCDLLFQCSDVTWACYNSWPDDRWSIYHGDEENYNANGRKKWNVDPSGTGSVSFDRPHADFSQDHLVKNPNTIGSGAFLLWEFPLSYWIEQQGYDVSYISGVDTHADGKGLQRAKGFVSVGHDEFWTREMFENIAAARDAGVNLAFLSGNTAWAVVSLSDSGETPHKVIRRESLFLGKADAMAFYQERGFLEKYAAGPDAAPLLGNRYTFGNVGGGDWVCAKPDHWLYEGTGMKKGDTVKGIVGWEWNSNPATGLPGFEILANGKTKAGNGKPKPPHAGIIYDGSKGNLVFNAGSVWWAQAMSSPPGHVLPAHGAVKPQGPEPRVQRMAANLFDRIVRMGLSH